MRAILGVLSLLVVVAIVGMLAKRQLSPGAVRAAPSGEAVSLPTPAAGTTAQQHSQQLQQQVRQSLENTLQQARPMPEGD